MKTIKLLLLTILTFNAHAYFIPINPKQIKEGAEILRERTVTVRFSLESLTLPSEDNKWSILRGQNSMNEDGRFSLDLTKGQFFALDLREHNLRTSFKKGRDSLGPFGSDFEGTDPSEALEEILKKFKSLANEQGIIEASLNIKLVKSTKKKLFEEDKCDLGVDEIATLTFDNELVFNDYRFGFVLGNDDFDLTLIENVFCE